MMKIRFSKFLLVLMVSYAGLRGSGVAAQDQGVPLGIFTGGGRACTGKLSISRQRLAWETPFSHCGASPYRQTKVEVADGLVHHYLLTENKQRACLYQHIELTEHAGKDVWDAIGFLSQADEDAQLVQKGLACPLFKTSPDR